MTVDWCGEVGGSWMEKWRSGAVGFSVALLLFAGSDEGNVRLLVFFFFNKKKRERNNHLALQFRIK